MEKEMCEFLARYNKEANLKMNSVIKTLSEEEWNKTFPGYFKSIHELCSHIFICDYNWLLRLKAVREFSTLSGAYFGSMFSFSETIFSTIDEYISKRAELDDYMIQFAREITVNDLNTNLKWTDSHDAAHENHVFVLLLHLAHHETHHRGVISHYLEALGRDNDYSALHIYENR